MLAGQSNVITRNRDNNMTDSSELAPPNMGTPESEGRTGRAEPGTELFADGPDTQSPTDMIGVRRPTTAKTMAEYAERSRLLIEYSSRIRSSGPEDRHHPSPGEIVDDMIRRRPGWKKATWVLYRSAMLWYLAPRRIEHSHVDNAWLKLKAASVESLPSEIKTARRRIPEPDLKKLLTALLPSTRREVWKTRTANWLAAGLASGLRPSEWANATWTDESNTALRVVSLKEKLDNPFVRNSKAEIKPLEGAIPDDRIRIVPIKPNDVIWVQAHMNSVAEVMQSRGFDRTRQFGATNEDLMGRDERDALIECFQDYYYTPCRKSLLAANKITFSGKKSYSLYSIRSQWFANRKNEVPIEQVRAEGGHVEGSQTTLKNYGYKRSAYSRVAEKLEEQQGLRTPKPRSACLTRYVFTPPGELVR